MNRLREIFSCSLSSLTVAYIPILKPTVLSRNMKPLFLGTVDGWGAQKWFLLNVFVTEEDLGAKSGAH